MLFYNPKYYVTMIIRNILKYFNTLFDSQAIRTVLNIRTLHPNTLSTMIQGLVYFFRPCGHIFSLPVFSAFWIWPNVPAPRKAVFTKQLNKKLIDNCTSDSAPSPCIEISSIITHNEFFLTKNIDKLLLNSKLLRIYRFKLNTMNYRPKIDKLSASFSRYKAICCINTKTIKERWLIR